MYICIYKYVYRYMYIDICIYIYEVKDQLLIYLMENY